MKCQAILLRLMSLYRTALQDEDDHVRPFKTLDDFYNIYTTSLEITVVLLRAYARMETILLRRLRTIVARLMVIVLAKELRLTCIQGCGMAIHTNAFYFRCSCSGDGSCELRVRAQPHYSVGGSRWALKQSIAHVTNIPIFAFPVLIRCVTARHPATCNMIKCVATLLAPRT